MIAKIGVTAFMLAMLAALLGAIPMAIWAGQTFWLIGLFAFVFFAV